MVFIAGTGSGRKVGIKQRFGAREVTLEEQCFHESFHERRTLHSSEDRVARRTTTVVLSGAPSLSAPRFPRFPDTTFYRERLLRWRVKFLSARHRGTLGGSDSKAGRAIEGLVGVKNLSNKR